MIKNPLRIGFMASNRGSNMLSILKTFSRKETQDHFPLVEPTVLVTHNPQALALEKAQEFQLPTAICQRDDEILEVMQKHRVNLICLCGYLRKVSMELIRTYPSGILNIHPSLLPKYGGKGFYGKKVHQAVLEDGQKWTGATVHWVTENYDEGGILAQRRVPVLKGDTVETLQKRVFEAEAVLYPEVLSGLATKSIDI